MSVITETYKAGPYECDGVQKVFPFLFPVLESDHVSVWLDENRVESGYTVVLTATGGSVELSSAPAIGRKLTILRDVPFTQETDIQNHTAFLPEVLETMSDKLTMECQQLKESIARAVKIPPNTEAGEYDIYLSLLAMVQESADLYNKMKKIIDEWSGQAGDIQYEVQGDSDVPVPEDPGITGLGYDVPG